MKFFVFLLFGGLLLIEASQSTSEEVSPRNVKDEAKKVLEKLVAAVDKAITQAQDAVDKAFNTLKEKATELESRTKDELQKAVNKLKSKMDDLNEKAKEKGIDITPCQSYETEFDQIPNTLMDDLLSCVNDKVTEAQNIVNDAIKNVKQVEQDVGGFKDQIDNCGHGLKQVKCIAKLVEKIVKDTTDAPQNILKDVEKATVYIATLEDKLEECAVGKVEKAGERAAEITAEFAVCAGLNV